MSTQTISSPEDILASAQSLRWEVGGDFHEHLMESIYTDAARIADRAVTRPDEKPRFDFVSGIPRPQRNQPDTVHHLGMPRGEFERQVGP